MSGAFTCTFCGNARCRRCLTYWLCHRDQKKLWAAEKLLSLNGSWLFWLATLAQHCIGYILMHRLELACLRATQQCWWNSADLLQQTQPTIHFDNRSHSKSLWRPTQMSHVTHTCKCIIRVMISVVWEGLLILIERLIGTTDGDYLPWFAWEHLDVLLIELNTVTEKKKAPATWSWMTSR